MNERETIPVIEEELELSKHSVITGKVRVETHTSIIEEIARAHLESSHVEVFRVPVDQEVPQVPEVRTEGDVTIIPVVEEVLVVEKRLVLKEEIHIKRSMKGEDVEFPVQLRKQNATVSRSES